MNDTAAYASGTPVQVALRELHMLLRDARFWGSVGAVTLVLGIAGPFGTGETLSFGERVTYWATVVVVTLCIAMPVSGLVGRVLERRGLPEWLCWLAGGAAASVPVTGFVYGFNRLVFADAGFADSAFWPFALQCAAVSIAVTMMFFMLTPGTGGSEGEADEAPVPRLAARLPARLGTDIVSLRAQDHYVEVTTTAGRDLILMRLSDAEAEMDGVPGLRVHRSWWIAATHLERIERKDGRVTAVLSDDTRAPVARGKVRAARALIA